MKIPIRVSLALVLLLAGARVASANCATDDPDGSMTAAARASAEQSCTTAGSGCSNAANHGAYVSCIANAANELVSMGMLPKSCKGQVKKCAAKSVCGKPGFVSCCITNKKNVTSCKSKKSADACTAKNGTVSPCASCCDACPFPGSGPTCPGGATTTTAAPTTTTAGPTTTTAAPTTTTAAPTTTTHAPTTTTAAPTTTTAAPTTTTHAPTTTTAAPTTTTAAPTTTTTIPLSLKFTNVAGSTSCGGPGLSPVPAAPFTGELDSDTACSTKTNDMGRGCLYIGGGNGKAIPPGAVPSGATNYLNISGSNLVASNGTGTLDCTKAAGPSKVCLNNDALPACTQDANCGGFTNACHEKANCYFGPPLEFPNPLLTSLTTCAINVVQTNASGTGDPSTGNSSVSLPLASEVYVTGNLGSPCPKCTSTCTYGPKVGNSCISGGSSGTSQDCPPTRGGGAFQAPLAVTLNPLSTGTVSLTSASGNFCPMQKTPGAFGVSGSQCIKTIGNPSGNLTDGMPHSGGILASSFCIPTTTNSTIDGVADLPGPGLTSLPGTAQIVPTP